MPVTITKKSKTKTKAKVEVTKSEMLELRKKTDRCGALKTVMEPLLTELAPLEEEYGKLKTQIMKLSNEYYSAEEKPVITGDEFILKLGKRANKVISIDIEKAFEVLGEETFVKLCKIGVTDLRKYCTPIELEQIIVEKPEGNRSWKLVEVVQ